MNTAHITILFALGLGAAGCTPAWAKSDTTKSARKRPARALKIKAYEVPEGSAERYRSMARTLLATKNGKRSLGRVAVAPDGRVVVVAPTSVHDDLAPLFAPTRALGTPPTEVSLTYWVIGAKRASTTTTDALLAEVGAPLEKIAERDGAHAFRLVDRIAVQSTTDARAAHSGQSTDVRQSLHARGSVLVADLQIRTRAAEVGPLDTSIAIVPNTAMVIGETAVADDERLIYLVRATVQ